MPADTVGIGRPVVGFFGLIERWIDLELIDYLAEKRPDWSFLMIGRVAVPSDQLPSRPNIHWIGQRSYESLPAYGKQFDAAIIPFQLTPVILHANPLKLREYLAMGKPIVSVRTPEIEKYADVVKICDSREGFLAGLDTVLARPDGVEEVARRMERVRPEGWDARLHEVFRVVEGHNDDRATEPWPNTQSKSNTVL